MATCPELKPTAAGWRRLARAGPWLMALLLAAALLAACGERAVGASKPGQALASVNGEEITTMQLNEELQRADVPAARQAAASKQLLKVLVDRQLLQEQAAKEKIDRDPKVMQAIERARAMIIAQAYMRKHLGTPPSPARAEIEDYYRSNPQFFANRTAFDLQQLVIATRDLAPAVKKAAETAGSLEELAAWLDVNQVRYARNRVMRSTSDMPPELSAHLLAMEEGRIFAVREGERSLLVAIAGKRSAPVTLDAAAAQIEQFLVNKRKQELAEAELARLRSAARIEYLNKELAPDGGPAAPAAAALPVAADSEKKAALERGVAGLK